MAEKPDCHDYSTAQFDNKSENENSLQKVKGILKVADRHRFLEKESFARRNPSPCRNEDNSGNGHDSQPPQLNQGQDDQVSPGSPDKGGVDRGETGDTNGRSGNKIAIKKGDGLFLAEREFQNESAQGNQYNIPKKHEQARPQGHQLDKKLFHEF
jgi:hypothetical protein